MLAGGGMKRVECEVEEVDIDDGDRLVAGVRATCGVCGHVTESFGVNGPSRRRCLALLREECPGNENNFYVDSEE